MPQLDLLSGDSPGSAFQIDYWSDPLHPEDEAKLTVTIRDKRGRPTQVLFTRVACEVIHELVSEISKACWEAWLFGEAMDVKHAFNATVAKWNREANTRRRNLELGETRNVR